MACENNNASLKGFKIVDRFLKRRIGIACSSLNELKIKGCKKLELKCNVRDVEILLFDGTIVDDDSYFVTLPSQTSFILRRRGENVINGVNIIYNALKSVNIELLRTASEVKLFFDKDIENKIKTLYQYLNNEQVLEKAKLNNRFDDPEWFEDLETLSQTKEEFMRKRSRGRILRYLYNTKSKIKCSPIYNKNFNAKAILDSNLNELYSYLKRDDFFGYYFDRSNNKSLCNINGVFLCQGLWNSDKCVYTFNSINEHQINPYVSKEQRILFGTWNLDHVIERSRSIIPSLLLACEICCKSKETYEININYFYDLLFTTKNLKLVHAVCHDKNEHSSAQCDQVLLVTKTNSFKNEKHKLYSYIPRKFNFSSCKKQKLN